MFLHPSLMFFTLMMALSIMFIISSDSWLVAWLSLEINLLAFLPLVFKKTSKYQSEAGLKYFLTQASASIILLMGLMWMATMQMSYAPVLAGALLMKAGAAPLHVWFINLASAISWVGLIGLNIFQKIGPFILMMPVLTKDSAYLFYLFILAGALVGAAGALMTPNLKKILAYSSVAHMSWMLSAMMLANYMWVLYFALYSLISVTLMMSFSKLKMSTTSGLMTSTDSLLKKMTMVNTLSLAGLPPFSGFFMKLMILNEMVLNYMFLLYSAMLTATLISLFFYMRMGYLSINKSLILDKSYTKMNNDKVLTLMNIIMIFSGSLIIILGFKL